MTDQKSSDDGERPAASSEASHDALGDTHLGRSLKELIKEIGREKDAIQKGLAAAGASGVGSQDGDAFDLSASRFDQDLEVAVSSQRESENGDEGTTPAANKAPARSQSQATVRSGPADADPELSQALAGMESILQRFAEAERRRCEQQLAEWKEQLKKATMIVIKKQVENAREKWMQNQSASQAKVAAQFQKLKILADKVARQKAQIQKAKMELEQKLEVADRLHDEFDEIRNVLDGQIGAIKALDDGDDSPKS